MTRHRQLVDAEGNRLFACIRRDNAIALSTGVLSPDNVETLVQMLIESGEPMKYSLLDKLCIFMKLSV